MNQELADKIDGWLLRNCKGYDKQGYYVIRAQKISRYLNALVSKDCPICGSGCCLNEQHDKGENNGKENI